ncbi:MAG: SDR family oxidoreductase [Candidatus Zixiibacteriota bacterium]|nr:MAG: SDR family oxidoreductase [candidate division Zixibacteria bacterium]
MLNGKYALITGANRGIGKAIVEIFARNKCNIIANSRTGGSLENLGSELKDQYRIKFHPLYFDVSDSDQVKESFKELIKITKDLDIVVNNAGVLVNNLLGMVSKKTINDVFSVNAFAAIYVMQYASRLMIKNQKGSIINISSIVGVAGNAGQVVYSGSKSALLGITRSAAKELAAYNIRVNSIAPGFIDTDMIKSLSPEKYKERFDSIKMKRLGTPEDVANCALFLASDLSSYITGQVIGVDGGMLI